MERKQEFDHKISKINSMSPHKFLKERKKAVNYFAEFMKNKNKNFKDVSNRAIDETYESLDSKTDNRSGVIDKYHKKFST